MIGYFKCKKCGKETATQYSSVRYPDGKSRKCVFCYDPKHFTRLEEIFRR